jgi:hypothetical protein
LFVCKELLILSWSGAAWTSLALLLKRWPGRWDEQRATSTGNQVSCIGHDDY